MTAVGQEVNSENFEEEVLENDLPVAVVFSRDARGSTPAYRAQVLDFLGSKVGCRMNIGDFRSSTPEDWELFESYFGEGDYDMKIGCFWKGRPYYDFFLEETINSSSQMGYVEGLMRGCAELKEDW